MTGLANSGIKETKEALAFAIEEIQSLTEQNQRYREALEAIEKLGHGYGHGKGYTCATMAKKALEEK